MTGRVRTSGILIVILGVWGGIVPFVGPTFGFGAGTSAWTWTVPFATLNVAAAVAAVVGGFLLLSGGASGARAGGALAVVGGMWFVLGPIFQPLWHQASVLVVVTGGPSWMDVAKVIGYHDGTGLLITFLGAYALGVLSWPRRVAARSAEPVAPRRVDEAA
ncbi:MAG TPA: hypothetical protein VE646_04155 [Actinomycetota bacterium]|jgi:hypothetical protein|nr:hypothetical protein [Actinomycetota bacterium]